MADIDRTSDTPLSRQIATTLQYRIATGKLAAGTALPSYRAAGLEWGVNLHTVRRAYLDLAEAGLVRIGDRRGAVVLEYQGPPAADALQQFARETLAAARQRFGVGADDLIEALRRDPGSRVSRPPVWLVECSWSLSRSLAQQVAAQAAIDARAWLTTRAAEIPPGTVITTYFHFDEVRRLLPARADDLEVVHIRPSLEFLDTVRAAIGRAAKRILLLDSERAFAHGIVPELRQALGAQVEIVPWDPRSAAPALASRRPRDLVLVSPRDWDRLPPRARARPHVHRFAYEVDSGDLGRIIARRGWGRPAVGIGRTLEASVPAKVRSGRTGRSHRRRR
jgi:DNA-binding transcriptional regulator YhcF (GntR family)